MGSVSCNVVYINRRIRKDRLVKSAVDVNDGAADEVPWESSDLRDNVRLLLDTLGDVHVCATGAACITQLCSLQDESMVDLRPTIVLIDTPHDEPIPEEVSQRSRSPSPRAEAPEIGDVQVYPEEEVYGLRLLQKIVSEAHLRNISSLVVPIPLVSYARQGEAPSTEVDGNNVLHASDETELDRRLLKRCLDLGAADVMVSPMHTKSMTALEIHAYRAHKDAARDQQAMLEVRRGRKRSWVGISDNRPFAYLREAMVSNLMKMICQMGGDQTDNRLDLIKVSVTPERKARIAFAIGQWHFCAHDFSDDELIVAASLMFKHALAMPELEGWRIPTDQMTSFLIACRAAYNNFVPYHNFRHVVDVLQATFSFLVNIQALPPYPSRSTPAEESPAQKSPIVSLIGPFEALTLLITAIGHDVGHPGVNNGFLVVLNTPLAQLYNDRSVLESFHCAAYSQILRRYWPLAFEDIKMRKLMISSILATDMGVHFDYMKKMKALQDKLHAGTSADTWDGAAIDEHTALACALLIKCADISNVARKQDAALQWMHILADEFSRQASMESEAEIPSSLFAVPRKDILSLSKSQIAFTGMFALPLFKGVADLMPPMQYTVDELEINQRIFEQIVVDETTKEASGSASPHDMDGPVSPKTVITPVPSNTAEQDLSTVSRADFGDKNDAGLRGGFIPGLADPAAEPAYIPDLEHEHAHVNGTSRALDTSFDGAHADPFSHDGQHPYSSRQQRCSEATDGSASVPGGGDWASQATSATTGKMPISPSTQGTSIVSRDSLDRHSSVPVTMVTASNSSKSYSDPKLEVPPTFDDDMLSVSSNGNGRSPDSKSMEGKTLKKKTSRFLNLFRRHKGASPPLPAADTVS